ncbi:uncharacterized protein [Henckelia pumila]|uniref:uncharacterized protein n=1 Tax=Henckelia pumila TaxID=405737 RepID=UPI003C6E34E2
MNEITANLEQSTCIIDCLNKYEAASGQKVNFDKSSISFSANVSNELKNTLCEVLGVNYTTNHGKYLGLPSLIGRNKREVFDFIKEKAWGRMNGWRNKFLSRAGKEILLKAVVQAIPSYVMSVFALPINLCDELERMMNSFWWEYGAWDLDIVQDLFSERDQQLILSLPLSHHERDDK